jgi:nucleoside-diphosphate-sugar epimerase
MTANLLEGLVQGGFEGKVIYASSSEVYGDPLEIPTPETHPAAVRPGVDRDGYAASKVVGEMQMRLTAEAHGWDWLVLRIFNCYGPRMDNTEFGQVVPEFIRKVRSDDEFTIIGDGRQTRSFCFVGDIVTQTLRCTDDFNQDVVNIGNDAEVEILDVAQRIHSIAGREFRPEHLPAWPGDHRRRCPSLAKLRERLGDVPLVGLGEGLATTYEYYANDSEQRR